MGAAVDGVGNRLRVCGGVRSQLRADCRTRRPAASAGSLLHQHLLITGKEGQAMNIKLVTGSRLAGALVLPIAGHAATDSDLSSPKAFN